LAPLSHARHLGGAIKVVAADAVIHLNHLKARFSSDTSALLTSN
jgi:hypothetical protein